MLRPYNIQVAHKPMFALRRLIIANFRSEYEYDYEYEFSVLSTRTSKNVDLET